MRTQANGNAGADGVVGLADAAFAQYVAFAKLWYLGYAAATSHSITVRATSTDGSFTIAAFTIAILQAGPTTTVEVRVIGGSDDAEERADGKVNLRSSDLELVFDRRGNQTVGMRFADVAIPQGATILGAHLRFKAEETHSDPTSLSIQGEAADHAVTFTTTSGNISSRPRTTAAVPWSPPAWTKRDTGLDQQSPDIATLVQEIVDRPGWSSLNALAIIITGTGERVAESYQGDAAGAPLLHVEYQ